VMAIAKAPSLSAGSLVSSSRCLYSVAECR
jgi:hypothetical protein